MSRKLVLAAALVASALVWGCGDRTTIEDNPDSLVGKDLQGMDLHGYDLAQLDQGGGKDTPWVNDGWVAPDGWVPPTDDGTPQGDTAIMAIQKSAASAGCVADPATGKEPAFTNGEENLELTVIVTSPQYVASKDSTTGNPKLFGYFVADANVSAVRAWGGIALIIDAAQAPDFQVGDVLAVTADHTEYYCFSQIKAKAFEKTGVAAVPAPLEIDPADLAKDAEGKQDAARAEPLEGVLVKLTNVTVTKAMSPGSDGLDHGAFEVAGGVVIEDDWKITYRNNRKEGDKFTTLVGLVRYSYGQYYVAPRDDADMVLEGQVGPDVIEPPVDGEIVEPGEGIAAIQQSAESAQCGAGGTDPSFTNGATGIALDVVVVSPRYIASKDKLYGYIVADAGVSAVQAWGGIALVIDFAADPQYAPGTVLRVTGDHTDYYCFSQLKVTGTIEVVGTQDVPAPVVIDPADLAQDAGGVQDHAKAEKWEGVLVKMTNVTVTKTPSLGSDGKDHGAFEVAGGVIVEDDWAHSYVRNAGDAFDSITGVVRYSFGKYYVAPRGADDLVLGGAPGDESPDVSEGVIPTDEGQPQDVPEPAATTVLELQTTAASTGCTSESNAKISGPITFKNLVVTTPKFSAGSTLHGYYVADAGTNAASTGVYLVVGKAAATNFAAGDVLTVVGDHYEYYCFTEINVNTTAGGSMTKTGTAALAAPVVLTAAELASGGTAALEPYEGLIVTVEDVAVTAAAPTDTYSWFEVGTGIAVVKDFTYAADAGGTAPFVGAPPAQDTQLASITGALKFYRGKYRIAPRTAADIVVAQ